ncbi:MAG TPA: PAS domain-containing protein [Anaerolineaceae bacterium]
MDLSIPITPSLSDISQVPNAAWLLGSGILLIILLGLLLWSIIRIRQLKRTITQMEDRLNEIKHEGLRWQFAIEGSGDGIWDWNVNTNELYYSNLLYQMLGYQPGEFKPHLSEWDQRIHPEDREQVYATLQACLSGKVSTYTDEYRLLCKDGTYKWILDRGKVLEWNPDGSPKRMIGSHTDITKQKQFEEQLLKSEAQFRLMTETMEDVLWQTDENYIFTYISPSIEILTGYPPDHFLGKPVWEFIPYLNPEQLHSSSTYSILGSQNQAANIGHKFQYQHLRKDGKTTWVEVIYTMRYQADGKWVGVQGVSRNISDHKATLQALQESEQLLHLVMDHIPFGIYWKDKNGMILGCNQTFLNDSLYPSYDDVIGKTDAEMPWRENAEKFIAEERSLIESGLSSLDQERYEEIYPGRFYWLRFNRIPLRDAEGKVFAILGIYEDITRQKQVLNELTVREQELRSLMQNVPGVVYRCEIKPPWQFILASDGTQALTGYDPADFLNGKVKWGELVHPEDFEMVNTTCMRGVDQHLPFEIEYRIYNRKGEIRYVYEKGKAIYSDTGEPEYLDGVIIDTTPRKLAEEALIESNERFKFVMEATQDGVWDQYLTMDSCYLSPAYSTMLGYEPGELTASFDTFLSLLHPDDYQKTLQENLDCRNGVKKEIDAIFRLRTKQGGWRWIHSRGKPVAWDAQGKPARLVGTHVDITEKQLLEEALKKRLLSLTDPAGDTSNLSLGDLFDLDEIQTIQDAFAKASGIASVITDPQGNPITQPSNYSPICKLIRSSEAGLQTCQYSDAMLGTTDSQRPIPQPCLSIGLWNAGARIMVGEHHVANWIIGQVMDISASEESLLMHANQIGVEKAEFLEALKGVRRMSRDEFQELIDLLSVLAQQLSRLAIQNIQQAREIAKRMDAEARLQELNLALEERVRSRTLQLEAANRELEAFSYSVSHDLRAPLRSMEGFSQALMDDFRNTIPELAQDYLFRIRKNSQRMSQLIDDLLKLSRISRSDMQIREVDLSSMAEEILAELAAAQPERQVIQKIQPQLMVRADKNLIRIALSNLLSNAWKFTSKHPIALIEMGSRQENGETVYYVKDDGAGFDMAYAGKLFSAFQRLHNINEFEGSGIGLALVQRIIHRHGGHIWAESVVEQGATFYFTLNPN